MNINRNITKNITGHSGFLNKALSTIMLPLLLVGVLAIGLVLQTATVQGATSYYGYITGVEKQATAYTMLGKVNAARQTASVGALKWDTTLENAAMIRARESAIYFSHTRPTGASWYTVSTKMNAENLYVGYNSTASTANSAWMDSSGHRANRLNSAYRSYAAAAFKSKDGVVYWVEVFSRSSSENTAYRGADAAKTDLPVKMSDGYLNVKGSLTDSTGGSLATNSMRAGGSYFLTLKNWNKQFSYSFTAFSKGKFASGNTGIATIDPTTGKITTKRAGVVKFYARISADSDKLMGYWEVIRPQKVSGFVAEAKVHAASLKWNSIAGANGYEVYRATSITGTYSKIASVSASATSYTQTGLKSGASYYYKVRAYVVKSGSATRYPGHSSTPIKVTIR